MLRVFDYSVSSDPISGLDIRVKMLVVIAISIVTLIKWNLATLLILVVITVLPYAIFARSSIRRLKWWGRLIGATIALLIISQGFFYWGYYQGTNVNVLFYVFMPHSNPYIDIFTNGMGIALTSQGLFWGILAGLKFTIMALAAVLSVMSISPRQWSSFISWLSVPVFLQRLFLATIRMTPMIFEESLNLYAVARLRKPASLGNKIKLPYRLIKSMIFVAIRRAMLLTIALEIKGEPKFRPEGMKLRKADVLAALLWTSAIVVVGLV